MADDEIKRELHPPPPVSTPIEAPWTDMATLIAAVKALTIKVDNLVDAISGGIGIGGEGGPSGSSIVNLLLPALQRDAWDHEHVYVPSPGTAVPLPSFVVPAGFHFIVRALPDNTDDIYIGKNKSYAQEATKRITLAAGESIRMKISNASLVWIDAAVANEGAEYFSEV